MSGSGSATAQSPANDPALTARTRPPGPSPPGPSPPGPSPPGPSPPGPWSSAPWSSDSSRPGDAQRNDAGSVVGVGAAVAGYRWEIFCMRSITSSTYSQTVGLTLQAAGQRSQFSGEFA